MVRVPKRKFLKQSFSIKTVKSFYGLGPLHPLREFMLGNLWTLVSPRQKQICRWALEWFIGLKEKKVGRTKS